MVEEARSRLGRGLSALLGDDADDHAALEQVRANAKSISVSELRANRYQPRKVFDAEALEELASSIREKGILQPLIVRRNPDGNPPYEIIAGERRWRAAQRAGLHDVPVILKDLSDAEVMEVALIENIQREDLNSVEEAAAYRALIEQFQYTQEQLSRIIGKSRAHVANALRLLSLPGDVQQMVREEKITAGHARTLVGSDNPVALAQAIVAEGLTVRDAEDRARDRKTGGGAAPAPRAAPTKDADIRALEDSLGEKLGFKVDIVDRGGKGEVKIAYRSLDQLDEICRRLSNG